jgi:hypothetical protein
MPIVKPMFSIRFLAYMGHFSSSTVSQLTLVLMSNNVIRRTTRLEPQKTMHPDPATGGAVSEFGSVGSVGVRFRSTEVFRFFDLPHPFSVSTFGFGCSAEGHTEKPLRFFSFLQQQQRVSGTHNPLVPGSSPGGPTISIKFMALCR